MNEEENLSNTLKINKSEPSQFDLLPGESAEEHFNRIQKIDPALKPSLLGDVITLAGSGVIAAGAKGAALTWGGDKVFDVGMQAIAPDVQETVLEQGLKAANLGLGAKVSRGFRVGKKKLGEMLTDIFDNRVDRDYFELSEDFGLIDEVLAHKDEVIFKPGSVEENIAQTTQAINPHQKKVFFRTYSKSFAKGRGGFQYNEWRNYLREHLGSTKAKYSLESFQTRDTQFVRQWFTKQKEILKPAFLEEYGPWLAKNGIDPETLELHHIFGVMQSAGLYDGLEHMDEGWELVTGIMNKYGLFPGAPALDEFSNFRYVTKELHDILHHQFLTKRLGVDGGKFFDEKILYNGKRMKRIDIVNSGMEGRALIAEEYAKIIAEGRDLMDDGLLQMEALFSKSGIQDPDTLVEVLTKATDKGDIFLGDTDLLLESVNKELKAIAKDVNWEIDKGGIGKIKTAAEDINETSRKIKKKYNK